MSDVNFDFSYSQCVEGEAYNNSLKLVMEVCIRVYSMSGALMHEPF